MKCLVVLILLLAPAAAPAVTIWNETVQGDLPQPPVRILLVPGDNQLFANLDPILDPVDRIEIEIPPGFFVQDLLADDDELAPGLDLYTLTPVSSFDVPTVIGAGTLIPNVLDRPVESGPTLDGLDPGIWELEIKLGGPMDPPYSLNFVLVPIPESSAAWLLGSGLAGLALGRYRSGRR